MNKHISFADFFPLIKETLDNGGETIITITGMSMLPLFRDSRDRVLLVAPKPSLKKYDIPLYRRDDGTFVLHRIVGIKNGEYVLCGDRQYEREYPIRHEQIIGVVKGFWRGDKYIPADSFSHRTYSRIWNFLLPVRKYVLRLVFLFYAARRRLIEGFGNSKVDL